MTKSIFVSVSILFFASFANAQTAQTDNSTAEVMLKKDISYLKSEESSIKQEIKTEKSKLSPDEIASLNAKEAKLKRAEKMDKDQLRKRGNSEVSYQATQEFSRDFLNVTLDESRNFQGFDEFRFTKNDKTMTVFYDTNGKLVGTSEKSSFENIPAIAQKFITNKYGNYTIGDVIFYDDSELNETDMVFYGQSFEDKDNYFVELDKGGKRIALKVDMEGNVAYFGEIK